MNVNIKNKTLKQDVLNINFKNYIKNSMQFPNMTHITMWDLPSAFQVQTGTYSDWKAAQRWQGITSYLVQP